MRGIYNLISIVFLVLTLGAIGVFGFLLLSPTDSEPDAPPPTVALVPTATNTAIPTATRTPLPPTFTPTSTLTVTPSNTPTVAPTNTEPPTASPTPTITATPRDTNTPTATLSPTPTVGPTNTAPPPLPFALEGEVTLVPNTFNTAGCSWQGIGGQVLGINDQPYTTQLRVQVTGPGQSDLQPVSTGTNQFYGRSGFEVKVADAVTAATYTVTLQSPAGTVVAPPVRVTFPATCDQNTAILTFKQVRPLTQQ